MAKLRVAVLFGGVSSEHEVSLMSAASVIENLPRDEFEIIPIGITKKGRWLFFPGDPEAIRDGSWEYFPDNIAAFISPDRAIRGIVKTVTSTEYSVQKIDVVFPVLHGKNGEDGTIQGLFEIAGIPFVGCDTLSSAMCMDKTVTNMILDHTEIPHAPWGYVTNATLGELDTIIPYWEQQFGYPMFVKPANAGSSVGISKAHDRESLKQAINVSFAHDAKVIVEKSIVGRELECAVLGNEQPVASAACEIFPRNEFYDYDAKYVNASRTQVPADIPDELADRLRKAALDAYRVMGCRGMARIDFLYESATDTLFLNELNTIPGFTPISMYPEMMRASGVDYPALLSKLIHYAMQHSEEGHE